MRATGVLAVVVLSLLALFVLGSLETLFTRTIADPRSLAVTVLVVVSVVVGSVLGARSGRWSNSAYF